MQQLKTATRQKTKIKIGISAPTGFGKTYSALLLAYGLVDDWSKIAVIDTENGSADLYSDLGNYNTLTMEPPYTVDNFINAFNVCLKAGMECIIIDSTFHYWHGKGGLLEYNSQLGGRFQDWAKTNPLWHKWLDTILQAPVHVICTSRKKQAYEIVENNGKKTVEKKGMEDQIRDGFEYELTVNLNIVSGNHLASQTKDRTRLFVDKQDFVITPETGRLIRKWCETGAHVKPQQPEAIPAPKRNGNGDVVNASASFETAIKELKSAKGLVEVTAIWQKYPHLKHDADFVAAIKEAGEKYKPKVAAQ